MSTTTKKILNTIKTLPKAKSSLTQLVNHFGVYHMATPEVFRIHTNEITEIIHQNTSKFTNKEIENAIAIRLKRVPFRRKNLHPNDRRRLISRLVYQENCAKRKARFKIFETRLIHVNHVNKGKN